MTTKTIASIGAIFFIVVGVYLFTTRSSDDTTSTPTTGVTQQTTKTAQTAVGGAGSPTNQKQAMNINPENAQVVHGATLKTSFGDIEVVFSETTAPKTVANFISLASTHFYDGTKFHRVISGFMIQGGDPLSKDESKTAYWGTGGPGYQFPDELSGKEEYTYGTLAMANSGRNTNGSQFFIVSANPRVDLPALYTVFGKVVSGMDVVEKIQNVATDKSNDRPIENVVLKGVVLK